jgi:GTPase SAR1 family protein
VFLLSRRVAESDNPINLHNRETRVIDLPTERSNVRKILESHSKLRLQDANEAETRLKLIDRVIFEALGWTHDDVTVEDRVSEDGSTTFSDYIVKTAFSTFVIEAKRIGSSELVLPNKRKESLTRRLVSGDTGAAIRQVRDYARKLSIPFAVATNGSQWIVFPATRTDGVTFEQSSAIIFPNIESALGDDFPEFYGLLSRESVIGGSLETELIGQRENQFRERRLNQYFTRPFTKITRNSLFPIIEKEVLTAFAEDIALSDPDLLRKCYVDTPERLRYDRQIGMHIAKRDSASPSSPLRAITPQGRGAFSDSIARAEARAKPLALLVLGTVGAGKTTFINYIRNVKEAEKFKPRKDAAYPQWIYADCRKLSPSESPSDFFFGILFDHLISDDFLRDYDRCLKHAYKTEIDALKRGPLSVLAFDEKEVLREIAAFIKKEYDEKKPFCERVYSYAAQRAGIFLVVDNVDQFEDQTMQTKIFSDAIAIAQRLGLSLILAMRDSTFVQNKSRPVFDAFDFDPVQVDPPEVKAVLSRRFSLARELLTGKPSEFVAENGVKVTLSDSGKIIDLIVESVLNTEVGNAISVLSTGDIRLCLRMTRDFLRNGYSATGKAMRIFGETGRYRLPPHEAMRAIMLGSQPVYCEEFSPVGNPFDSRLAMNSAQLLRLFILNAMVSRGSIRSAPALSGEEVRAALLNVGFSPDIALHVLQDMCDLRFIFTTSHSKASFEATFVPSRLGGHIVRSLIADFVFLENTMMDTFIDNDDVWLNLKGLTDDVYSERAVTRKIQIRVLRVKAFYEYLTKQYAVLQAEAVRRAIGKDWLNNPFTDMQGTFNSNVSRVTTSASRNYGPPPQ